MLNTPRARHGMVTSPHHLASQAGLEILRDGGTAIEAAVAMAACLSVVYPHMSGIGGDGFWLIMEPGREPIAIDACGVSARAADGDLYRRQNLASIPWRGPLAANTVAGTISGWQAALEISAAWAERLPLSRILRDAIEYAASGIFVTAGQSAITLAKKPELESTPGFADVYMPGGEAPREGQCLKQPALAATLQRLSAAGLDDFYRGELARSMAADLERLGALVTLDDLQSYRAERRRPLSVRVSGVEIYNLPPPTQGLASLMILALFDRLKVAESEGFDHVHGLVEATKLAFLVRDREIADPATMKLDPCACLSPDYLDQLAGKIDRARALPWPAAPSGGDTVWLGVVDGQGRAVSFIQSIYFDFGSGLLLPESGVLWQNRGSSFSLDPRHPNTLKPGKKPFHTLNPAAARFDDGRSMVYGTMGGEGQPQTQAAIFSRYAFFGQGLQQAVTAPRWLLGRTWGDQSTTLKLENRFDPAVIEKMRNAGHDIEVVEPFTSTMMGHAGAIVRHPDGPCEGAADPRSDGAAVGW